MKTKHTPGVCSVCSSRIYDQLGMCLCNNCRDRLPPMFAAAPELLEALHSVLNFDAGLGLQTKDELISEIHLVISKATGGAE